MCAEFQLLKTNEPSQRLNDSRAQDYLEKNQILMHPVWAGLMI